jgi:SSS family solute:Na+ symporter
MQFLILLIGALVFAFYSFHPAPLYFNSSAYNTYKTNEPQNAAAIETRYLQLHRQYEAQALAITTLKHSGSEEQLPSSVQQFTETQRQIQSLREAIQP